jgi:hypothetical protein
MVLAGFSRDILAEFNNCNYEYFDITQSSRQDMIIDRLKLLKPRYKFLRKIRVKPEDLRPEKLVTTIHNYIIEINNRAMLDGKKRYNSNDVIAEFKRLMLVPYIVNYVNEYERPKLKEFIISDLTEKSSPGDKYYKMVVDWVKASPNFDVIVRNVLSECAYSS